MKITKNAANRSGPLETLSEKPPVLLAWNKDTSQICLTQLGVPGKSTYEYKVTLSAAEILWIVERGIDGCVADSASRAMAFGAAAILRELLVPKKAAQPKK